ncbi:MAG: hypothetical protein ACTSRS_04980 [Candidatus Helarchaeota archaeon]
MGSKPVKKRIQFYETLVERIESQFRHLKIALQNKEIRRTDFESKKINLLEEIKKVKYELNSLKEQLSIQNEREQLILQQFNLLSQQFQADLDVETWHATVYLSIALDKHFTIDIDCSGYPEPPYLFMPKEVLDYLGGEIYSEIKLLKKWSVKKPPNIVDIFKELEEKLIRKAQKEGEQVDTGELLLMRRRSIERAREAESRGAFREAIKNYEEVIKISEMLHDRESCNKYKSKIQEVQAYSQNE